MWGLIALTMSATKAIIIHKERNENGFGCKKLIRICKRVLHR